MKIFLFLRNIVSAILLWFPLAAFDPIRNMYFQTRNKNDFTNMAIKLIISLLRYRPIHGSSVFLVGEYGSFVLVKAL